MAFQLPYIALKFFPPFLGVAYHLLEHYNVSAIYTETSRESWPQTFRKLFTNPIFRVNPWTSNGTESEGNQPISADKNSPGKPKAEGCHNSNLQLCQFSNSIHMVQPGGYGCCHVVVFGASMWISCQARCVCVCVLGVNKGGRKTTQGRYINV